MKVFAVAAVALLAANSAYHMVQGQNPFNRKLAVAEFKEWQAKYKQENGYSTPEEENFRLRVFTRNLKWIKNNNEKNVNQGLNFFYALNQFSDLTYVEFVAKYLTPGMALNKKSTKKVDISDSIKGPIPESLDWVDQGKVADIKNQGRCGSCYAFGVIGVLESRIAIEQDTTPVLLSEQQIVDCSPVDHGCEGGWPTETEAYLRDAGVALAADYPYVSGQTEEAQECQAAQVPLQDLVNNVVALEAGEANLLNGLQSGPVVIAVNANNGWMSYGGGVFADNSCIPSMFTLNHAVIAVGYGSEGGQDYWIIRNSWSTGWGEDGYMRIVRNYRPKFPFSLVDWSKGMCGLALELSYPEPELA